MFHEGGQGRLHVTLKHVLVDDMRLADIELFNPDVFVRGVPHEAFRFLRAEAPVFRHEEPKGRGYWAVTKYEDVVAISKDPGRFSSWRGGTNIDEYPPEDLDAIRMLLVNMDPPDHGKFRRLVSTGFTPRMVARIEPKVRAATVEILDKVAGGGVHDFVRTVAAELPLRVIAELVGIPQEDRGKVFDWSNKLIGFDDPEFQNSVEDARGAAMEVWGYANSLGEKRKGEKGEDLVSVLMNAEVDGHKLSEMEFDSFFLLLAVAGNETTRNLISGGMLALFEHPDQRDRLIADPSLMPLAVDEMLRWVTPVMYFRRTATCDTEIRGQQIKENDKVVMYYSSANRDEDVFPDADKFDVGRTPNDHLAFGIGEHFCLGASLARLEIRVMFEELLKRYPKITPAGNVRRLRSNFINGFKEIPVCFEPEKG
jgi:cholest-4-en-3-one 26-monooxygenase